MVFVPCFLKNTKKSQVTSHKVTIVGFVEKVYFQN